MLVILPICQKDAEQALKVALWMQELGPQREHSCLMGVPRNMASDPMTARISDALSGVFHHVERLVPRDEDEREWPYATNHMFQRIVQEVEWNRGGVPFLWLEPDAIPRSAGWLDRVALEYAECGKAFMGADVRLPGIARHMSGIGVYHQMTKLAYTYGQLDRLAFDVALALQIFQSFHPTRLIQHEWKPEPFKTPEDLKRLRPEAVIYHQDKTGSLCDILRPQSDFKTMIASIMELNQQAAEFAAMTPLTVEKQPMTIAGEIRMHVTALSELIDGKTGRKQLVQTALRMAHVIGPAKKRK